MRESLSDEGEVDRIQLDPEPDDVIEEDGLGESESSPRWWRRPRELRRQLAWTLVGTALVSVLLVGGLNFVAARELLDSGTKDQLVGIGQARARAIETGFARSLAQVSAESRDLEIVTALEALSTGFGALEAEELSADQLSSIDEYYEANVIDPINALDLEPVTLDDYRPTTNEAGYVQYHYVVAPAERGEDASGVVDPGDGSGYSEAHAVHHPPLDAAASALGVGDVLLVSIDGDIVYSTEKRIDVGTNLVDGPYADTEIGRVVTDALPKVRAGNAVVADLQIYAPANGRPVFFAAAAVQSDTEAIGALVVEIPIEALDNITTVGEQWEDVGLESGESYVVGSDLVLHSESRTWIEDSEKYLSNVDDRAVADLIQVFGSPVGIQTVDTEPVRVALLGEEFQGTTRNYLGTETFSYSAPIDAPGVEWVVVVDIPLSDARDPLFDYATRLGIVLLIILPVAALAGLWLARRLTRPIAPVLDAATSIVEGERDPDIPDLGNDEFGDLGRRLGNMAAELGEREAELAEEYENRRQLLLAVLPERLVEATGEVTGTGELADEATAVAVMVDASSDEFGDEDRRADVLDQIAELADESMADRGIERIRASADGYLFLAGAGTPDDGVDDALNFASELADRFTHLRNREAIEIGLRIGIATGPVATGILERGGLTFGAWGQPVRQALAIAALSEHDEIEIDASTAHAAPAGWVRPSTDVVALDGEAMDLYALDPGGTSARSNDAE